MRPPDAERSAENIAQVLRPSGLAYVSFDGMDQTGVSPEAMQDHVVSADRTCECVHGPRRGMVWRFYDDSEVRELFRELEEVEFAVANTGQRRVWFHKLEIRGTH
jgi:sensor histidine kinase regulating citrate/malate metabolism